jgi:hypothetical protein
MIFWHTQIPNLTLIFPLEDQSNVATSFSNKTNHNWHNRHHVTTPLWAKCEGEVHTAKNGNLESSRTPENLELEFRGQNTSHWGVLYNNGKFLKCRCPKCLHMSHLDICSPSYGQKKGRESDSQPLKVGNQPLPDIWF